MEKLRFAFEEWIQDASKEEIAEAVKAGFDKDVTPGTVYQWMNRYRGYLREVLPEMDAEQQRLIAAGITVSFRYESSTRTTAPVVRNRRSKPSEAPKESP